MILARATINLPGLGVDQAQVLVDETDPYIADLLAAEYLVPVDMGEPDPPPSPPVWTGDTDQ